MCPIDAILVNIRKRIFLVDTRPIFCLFYLHGSKGWHRRNVRHLGEVLGEFVIVFVFQNGYPKFATEKHRTRDKRIPHIGLVLGSSGHNVCCIISLLFRFVYILGILSHPAFFPPFVALLATSVGVFLLYFIPQRLL